MNLLNLCCLEEKEYAGYCGFCFGVKKIKISAAKSLFINHFTLLSSWTSELKWNSCITCLCRLVCPWPTTDIVLCLKDTTGHPGLCRALPYLSHSLESVWVFLYILVWETMVLPGSGWIHVLFSSTECENFILSPLGSNIRLLVLHSSWVLFQTDFLMVMQEIYFNTFMDQFFPTRKSRN